MFTLFLLPSWGAAAARMAAACGVRGHQLCLCFRQSKHTPAFLRLSKACDGGWKERPANTGSGPGTVASLAKTDLDSKG